MARKKHSNRWRWVKHFNTDVDNTTYDSGRVTLFYIVFGVVTTAILFMCIIQLWAVIANKQNFDAGSFGAGVGGLLGGVGGVLLGVGGYLFGQGKGGSYTTTTTTGNTDPTETIEPPESPIQTVQTTLTVNGRQSVTGATGTVTNNSVE